MNLGNLRLVTLGLGLCRFTMNWVLAGESQIVRTSGRKQTNPRRRYRHVQIAQARVIAASLFTDFHGTEQSHYERKYTVVTTNSILFQTHARIASAGGISNATKRATPRRRQKEREKENTPGFQQVDSKRVGVSLAHASSWTARKLLCKPDFLETVWCFGSPYAA